MRRVETELAASIDRSAIAALSMLERDETVKGMRAGGAHDRRAMRARRAR
jgi:hypothetical protein